METMHCDKAAGVLAGGHGYRKETLVLLPPFLIKLYNGHFSYFK